MKLRTIYLIALMAILPASSAMALDGADLFQKKTCTSCHGKDAQSPILPIYPKLAGQ